MEPHTRSLAGILGPSSRKPPKRPDLDPAVGEAIAQEWRDYVEREAVEQGPSRPAKGRLPPEPHSGPAS